MTQPLFWVPGQRIGSRDGYNKSLIQTQPVVVRRNWLRDLAFDFNSPQPQPVSCAGPQPVASNQTEPKKTKQNSTRDPSSKIG